MPRVVMDHTGRIHIDAAIERVTERITDDVADDATMICPVLTGALRRSIGSEMVDDHTGRVYARKEYAAAVELGHRKVLWGRGTDEYVPAQPYLRPALFRIRTGVL